MNSVLMSFFKTHFWLPLKRLFSRQNLVKGYRYLGTKGRLVLFASMAGVLFYGYTLWQRTASDLKGPLIHPAFDLSLKPLSLPEKKFKGRVWLISYAAKGCFSEEKNNLPTENQKKRDTALQNQQFLHFSALDKGIDGHILYNKGHLDEAFKARNEKILKQPRGAGYWIWKPYIIWKTLCQVAPNDFVVYSDTGTALRQSLIPLLNKAYKSDIMLLESYHTNKRYIKRDVYHLMGISEKARDDTQLSATMVIAKNTPKARAFFKAWALLMEDERLATDMPSTLTKEHTFFVDHRHDQAVLTLLVARIQEKQKPYTQRPHFFGKRKDPLKIKLHPTDSTVEKHLQPVLDDPPAIYLIPFYEGLWDWLRGKRNVFKYTLWHHRRRGRTFSLFDARALS